MPANAVVQGLIFGAFDPTTGQSSEEAMKDIVILIAGVVIALFTLSTIYYSVVMVMSYKATLKLRGMYL